MKKLLLLAAAMAVATPMASMASQSDSTFGNNVDTNQLDNFFVAGNLGQTQYRTDISHRNSVFQNLRFGWRWNGVIGAEIGYAYLGRRKDSSNSGETSVNSRAATFGVNAKYNIYQDWYLTSHAGYLRSQRNNAFTCYYCNDYTWKYESWNNGWYGGVGIGYDVTHSVSIGLNYDNYHLQYGRPGSFRDDVNVAAYSASVEYRF